MLLIRGPKRNLFTQSRTGHDDNYRRQHEKLTTVGYITDTPVSVDNSLVHFLISTRRRVFDFDGLVQRCRRCHYWLLPETSRAGQRAYQPMSRTICQLSAYFHRALVSLVNRLRIMGSNRLLDSYKYSCA